MKYIVAGLTIDSITKNDLLTEIRRNILANTKTFIITPYSEFLYRSLKNPEILETLNQATFAVPDGIGIFWAKKFLSIPLTAQSYYGKITQSAWQAFYSTLAILVNPNYVRGEFAEKIPGSDLIYDLSKLAVETNKSVYLLGGFGDTPKIAADKLRNGSANKLRVAGYSNKHPEDPSILEDIKKSGADFLFVAYGPIKQEQWIVKHMGELPCSLFIGLGGTFDYVAGARKTPPVFVRSIGLEWLWRLFTQASRERIKRIWQATAGLMHHLVLSKAQQTLPYRKNVVAVIINKENKVLVGLRFPEPHDPRNEPHWQFPQGGLDSGEEVVVGARREAQEEMGITSLEYIKTSSHINHYDWPLGFHHTLRGQAQQIVYFTFTGTDSEINLFNPPSKQEFTEYKWVSLKDLVNFVHKRRKAVAKIIENDLT